MSSDIDPISTDEIAAIQQIEALPTMLEVVCRSTGMGFSALARVTDTRWIACQVHDDIAFGLKAGEELPLSSTICDEIRSSRTPVIIDNVALDPVYSTHHTPLLYGFQSYISIPVFLRNGQFFGTLCAIDPKPNKVNTPEVIGMLGLFAELISFHLHSQEQLEASEQALSHERQSSELREQFIAVLGHDLRNPLASIQAGTALMRRAPAERRTVTLDLIDRSIHRMSGLIDNVLDFARGRLGGGLSLTRDASAYLVPMLQQVIDELRSANPGRRINAEMQVEGTVDCDAARLAQMLSNLLANALSHGASDQEINVHISDHDALFVLSVSNSGREIPPDRLKNLFEPFFRESDQPSQQGLGLGLYIVAEIAKAHNAALEVTSNPALTRFTFKMPAHCKTT